MIYGYPLLRILTAIRVIGRVPKRRPIIIAANHRSMKDPLMVNFTCGREVYFLTNPRWFHKFFWLRWLLEWFSALSLENNAGMVGAVRALRRGRAIGIFPEGARYREDHLRPFLPGVGFLAIACQVPVVPVLITGSELSLWQTAPRLRRARIIYGEPLYPDGYKNTREDYARFAAKVREAIENLRGRVR